MFDTIDDIKRANKAADQYWFEPATMRFFHSRVGQRVYHGRYFVSSEQRERDTERRYSIRVAHNDGTIDTIGDFMAYATHRQAVRALDAYVNADDMDLDA